MSFYVRRTSRRNPAGYSFVGPIRSGAQAEREAEAWRDAGETAGVETSTAALRAEVRRWQKITHADDAYTPVNYQGQDMTLAAYRLQVEREGA